LLLVVLADERRLVRPGDRDPVQGRVDLAAHEALGGDPAFAPRNAAKRAANRQLFALNILGRLELTAPSVEPCRDESPVD
jgi:hypothetical protein